MGVVVEMGGNVTKTRHAMTVPVGNVTLRLERSYTSHKSQKHHTMARGQDFCKHASQMPLLHY